MTRSLFSRDGLCSFLAFVILICTLQPVFRFDESGAVLAAPPNGNTQNVEPKESVGGRRDHFEQQKTADLTLLINETLKIINNNTTKSATGSAVENGQPNFRDDWTFDRVEYDLMDFLQELNARYRYANNSQQPNVESTLVERQEQQSTAGGSVPDQSPNQAATAARETVTKTTVEAVKKELEAVSPRDQFEEGSSSKTKLETSTTSSPPVTLSDAAKSVLPISLASGDHDISESTWQYGIFDRFTRPRTTSTQSPDSLSASGSNSYNDLKSFNNDECGLRTYRVDPDYYPVSASADSDEISKELSQRRQRPPLGSFFSSHKKFHQTAATSLESADTNLGDDLSRDRPLESLPPFDRNGEPTNLGVSSGGETSEQHRAQVQPDGHLLSEDDRPSSDSEFNLSLRRQWLQQQIGSTLKILGLNGSQNSFSDYFNKTGPILRENMMKISSAAAMAVRGNKLSKSLAMNKNESNLSSSPALGRGLDGQEELGARQDELKLEARVIGGNDARLGDSPWSASLQALVSRPGTGGVEYRHYCGGTIISEWYILTAAHCLDFMVGRESRLFVVIGDLNWRMSAASVHGRRFGIEKLIIHGGYKSTAFGHDIGLIKTKESMKPLKVNGRYIINSVCLPERNVEHSGEAELVGWGLFSNRNEMADSLQIADVPILPRPLCVDLYRRRTGLIQWLIGVELITEKQICAGTFGRGICQGDSGSALVFNENVSTSSNDKPVSTSSTSSSSAAASRVRSNSMRSQQQRATIIGVVAFGGIRRCSYQSLPGVYMQTSKYLDWIMPRIQP